MTNQAVAWVTCLGCRGRGTIGDTPSPCRSCAGQRRLPVDLTTDEGRRRYSIQVIDDLMENLWANHLDRMKLDAGHWDVIGAIDYIRHEDRALYALACEDDQKRRHDFSQVPGLRADMMTTPHS